MAADFQQERLWKKSAARVQASAVKAFVAERTEQRTREAEEVRSKVAQRRIARSMAEQVKQFWGHVSALAEYETVRRRAVHSAAIVGNQLSHVTETQESAANPPRKRPIEEVLSGRSSPAGSVDFSPSENGVGSDDESTIAEQEAWELLNCVWDEELEQLQTDARTELTELLRERYPGVLTEYAHSTVSEEDFDFSDGENDSGLENSESHSRLSIDGLIDAKDRTEKSNGDLNRKDLIEISETSETFLPKSVINCNRNVATPRLFAGRLREYQLVALDWLQTMHRQKLPAILADERGLGRRVVTAAFICYLVGEGGGCPGPHLLLSPASTLHRWRRVLATFVPGLRVCVYSGNRRDRKLLRQQFAADTPPHLVLTSYIAYCRDTDWFVRRKWGLVVLSEVQNIVAAGSPEQILALCELRSDRRMLVMSGPHKENPIDLWNVLYLLFPVTYELHSDSCSQGYIFYRNVNFSLYPLKIFSNIFPFSPPFPVLSGPCFPANISPSL